MCSWMFSVPSSVVIKPLTNIHSAFYRIDKKTKNKKLKRKTTYTHNRVRTTYNQFTKLSIKKIKINSRFIFIFTLLTSFLIYFKFREKLAFYFLFSISIFFFFIFSLFFFLADLYVPNNVESKEFGPVPNSSRQEIIRRRI